MTQGTTEQQAPEQQRPEETPPRDELAGIGTGVPTTCIEHAYGSAYRLSFQIKVF